MYVHPPQPAPRRISVPWVAGAACLGLLAGAAFGYFLGFAGIKSKHVPARGLKSACSQVPAARLATLVPNAKVTGESGSIFLLDPGNGFPEDAATSCSFAGGQTTLQVRIGRYGSDRPAAIKARDQRLLYENDLKHSLHCTPRPVTGPGTRTDYCVAAKVQKLTVLNADVILDLTLTAGRPAQNDMVVLARDLLEAL